MLKVDQNVYDVVPQRSRSLASWTGSPWGTLVLYLVWYPQCSRLCAHCVVDLTWIWAGHTRSEAVLNVRTSKRRVSSVNLGIKIDHT